jgi:hypothetical protein
LVELALRIAPIYDHLYRSRIIPSPTLSTSAMAGTRANSSENLCGQCVGNGCFLTSKNSTDGTRLCH